MKDRREFLASGLLSLAAIAVGGPGPVNGVGLRTLSTWDLPAVSLNDWQAKIRELTLPPGLSTPKHTHPGFVLGYVLEGAFRFRLQGQPERVLSAGETFYEPPGTIHLPSSNANATGLAKVLVVGFGKKGRRFTVPL